MLCALARQHDRPRLGLSKTSMDCGGYSDSAGFCQVLLGSFGVLLYCSVGQVVMGCVGLY